MTNVREQSQLAEVVALPPSLGEELIHLYHRSSLLNKDPASYGYVFTDVPPDLPYVWPGPDQ